MNKRTKALHVKNRNIGRKFTTNRLSKVSTRQQSEDSIHKQLAAFERLLQHAMSRFSNENLYHLLCHVTNWAESRDSHVRAQTKRATKVAFKLKSMKQVRNIFEEMKTETKSGTSNGNTNEKQLSKTFDLFLNDLLYLKDLKKYFEDEIYKSLMRYHCDTSIVDRTSPTCSKEDTIVRPKVNLSEEDDSGVGSQVDTDDSRTPRKSPAKQQTPYPTLSSRDVSDESRYKETVKELQTLLNKWEGLLTHDEFNLNDFDPDSYHELMQFHNYSQFEPILRLVPDLFAKCYKCIDLAKTWLKLANIVLKEEPIPDKTIEKDAEADVKENNVEFCFEDRENYRYVGGKGKQSEEEFWAQVKAIQTQIEAVKRLIVEDEEKLHRCTEEMNALMGREERFSSVTSQFEKIDSLVTIATGEYQKSKTEQYAVANKMRGCSKNTPSYSELKSHLKRLDTEVAQNHWKVKSLEFEKEMIQEDFLVEMELRPSFIRFVGDTKEKIQDLERFLHVKREEKLKLEKQLALMKTNTERVRKIMRTYLGSASSSGESIRAGARSHESSFASTISEMETRPGNTEHSGGNRVDAGNEADVDSSGPFDGKSKPPRQASKQRLCKSGVILQKPKLVKKERPLSEQNAKKSSELPQSTGRASRTGPKPALKTTPRRVWENV